MVAGIFLGGCEIKLASHSIEPEAYLSADKTPAEVYQESLEGLFYNPFNFSHTDFGKLLLITIDDHPEVKTVELVVQNDNKGAFVLIYSQDGKVESYLNPWFSMDKKYLKPNKDWEIAGEQDFEYVFEDTPKGINFALDVKTKDGEQIKISLQENRKEVKRYSFLAAIGADLSEVKRFPFLYLTEAGFVPVEGTQVNFEIDGEKMKLTRVPIKVEGQKSYRTVYSFKPLPFFWNEERDMLLSPENLDNQQSFQKDNARYSLVNNHGHMEIESVVYQGNGHSASLKLAPFFPDIASLKTGNKISGKFCLGVDDMDGVIGGTYAVMNANGVVSIDFQPEKCWGPPGIKNWVSAYHYHGKLKSASDHQFAFQSEWTVQ